MDKELNLKRYINYMILGAVFNSKFSLEGIEMLKEDNIFNRLYTYDDNELNIIFKKLTSFVDEIDSAYEIEKKLNVDFNKYFVLYLDKGHEGYKVGCVLYFLDFVV